MDAKHTPQMALPWSFVANSWQYTTIYDGNGVPMCRFDLEDWDVDEDNQDRLEKRQAAIVATAVHAVNSHASLEARVKRLTEALDTCIKQLGLNIDEADWPDAYDRHALSIARAALKDIPDA